MMHKDAIAYPTTDLELNAMLRGDRLELPFENGYYWAGYRIENEEDRPFIERALADWEVVSNVRFLPQTSHPHFTFSPTGDHYKLIGQQGSSYQAVQVFYPKHDLPELLHLVGHGLGLKHLYQGDHHVDEAREHSGMTVFACSPFSISAAPSLSFDTFSLGIFDLKAIHYLYGPNLSTNGNTTHYFPRAVQEYYVWDAGGVDWFDSSAYSGSVYFDLQEGHTHSNMVAGKPFWIAYGSNIENVRTGAGNDVIYCNALDNEIHPGKGRNHIYGHPQGKKQFFHEGGNDIITHFKLEDTLHLLHSNVHQSRSHVYPLWETTPATETTPCQLEFSLHASQSLYIKLAPGLHCEEFTMAHIEWIA